MELLNHYCAPETLYVNYTGIFKRCNANPILSIPLSYSPLGAPVYTSYALVNRHLFDFLLLMSFVSLTFRASSMNLRWVEGKQCFVLPYISNQFLILYAIKIVNIPDWGPNKLAQDTIPCSYSSEICLQAFGQMAHWVWPKFRELLRNIHNQPKRVPNNTQSGYSDLLSKINKLMNVWKAACETLSPQWLAFADFWKERKAQSVPIWAVSIFSALA